MVPFAKAYHYMTGCPLAKLDSDPTEPSPLAAWFQTHMLDLFVDMFEHRDYLKASEQFTERLKAVEEHERVYDRKLKIRLFQGAGVLASLFINQHADVPIKRVGEFVHSGMEADVHLSRIKPNRMLELIWFVFEPKLPDIRMQDVWYHYCQWNARAYELKFEQRPYHLTLYYPMIGESIQFQYNTEGRFEVIADLINSEVFYANPSKTRCSVCRRCPEYLRMMI